MTDSGSKNDVTAGASAEVLAEIKKAAVQQVAKWVIGAFLGLAGFAAAGWWFYFEPKIHDYIVNAAGGVPSGAIIASEKKCDQLTGNWSGFAEGTGRFLIGAGAEMQSAYSTWDQLLPQGGVSPLPLTHYDVLAKGGEEMHQLSTAEMPQHNHALAPYLFLLQSDGNNTAKEVDGPDHGQPNLTSAGEIRSEGQSKGHNNIPPYVAVYFCEKE